MARTCPRRHRFLAHRSRCRSPSAHRNRRSFPLFLQRRPHQLYPHFHLSQPVRPCPRLPCRLFLRNHSSQRPRSIRSLRPCHHFPPSRLCRRRHPCLLCRPIRQLHRCRSLHRFLPSFRFLHCRSYRHRRSPSTSCCARRCRSCQGQTSNNGGRRQLTPQDNFVSLAPTIVPLSF